MSIVMKVVLPVLAVACTAYAQCSDSATKTVQNAGDASAFASCSTFSGSIAIATGTPGDISLSGLEKITGDLVVENNKDIKMVGAPNLEEIGGEFRVGDDSSLTALTFGKLKKVDSLHFTGLPNLYNLDFKAKITQAKEIRIENTMLQSLDGINIESAETIFIANNPQINDITMQLGHVGTSMVLADNNPQVKVVLPNLIWARNITMRNCSSVQLPSLASLNDSFGFYGNIFSEFAAPNLTEVGGALTFVSNTELTNVSFPQLTKIGGNMQIANNTKLQSISGFPMLKQILSALDMNGNMTEISFPALADVRGAINIQSSLDTRGACNTFQKLKSEKGWRGDYFCKDMVANPGGAGTRPNGSSNKPSGAAPTLNVQNGVLGLTALAAVLFL